MRMFVADCVELLLWNCLAGRSHILMTEEKLSQSHRVVDVERGLWRLSGSTTLLKAGLSRAGCSRQCPVRFWIFPRTETPQLVWSVTLIVKKLFLVLKLNFLNSGLCPFSLVFSLSITNRSLPLSSLLPPSRYLQALIRRAPYPQPFLL